MYTKFVQIYILSHNVRNNRAVLVTHSFDAIVGANAIVFCVAVRVRHCLKRAASAPYRLPVHTYVSVSLTAAQAQLLLRGTKTPLMSFNRALERGITIAVLGIN